MLKHFGMAKAKFMDMTKLIGAFLKGVGRYLRHDHCFHG